MRAVRVCSPAQIGLFTPGFLFLGPSRAQSGGKREIIPGASVDGVKLGDDFEKFQSEFPKHNDIDEDLPGQGCSERVYHWVDLDRNATGVYAYFRAGRIYQFSVHSPGFALPDTLKSDATETQVRSRYPEGRGFTLVGSGSAVVGGKDPNYWVVKSAGVAFELNWNQRQGERLVGGIDVFAKGAEFRPEGCISPPQEWKPIKAVGR